MGFRWLFRPERRKERPPLNGNRISRRRVRLQIETEKTRIGHQPLWDELSFACKSRRKKTPPCMLNHTEPLCTGCCMYSARRVSHRGNFIFPSGKLLFPQWETTVGIYSPFSGSSSTGFTVYATGSFVLVPYAGRTQIIFVVALVTGLFGDAAGLEQLFDVSLLFGRNELVAAVEAVVTCLSEAA